MPGADGSEVLPKVIPEAIPKTVPKAAGEHIRDDRQHTVNKSLQPRGSSGGHFEAGGGAAREHIFDADGTRELHGSAQPGGWNGGCPLRRPVSTSSTTAKRTQ